MNKLVWLFDLDNTLHLADYGIFQLINEKMTLYLANHLALSLQQASALRNQYWAQYGATLAGLQKHYAQINTSDFLKFSHPIAEILPLLVVESTLQLSLTTIPGQKIIFSNAPGFYVREIAAFINIDGYFDAMFGCDFLDYQCKPNKTAYQNLLKKMNITAPQCIMVDDSHTNLVTAKKLGMATVWMGSKPLITDDYIDLAVESLNDLSHQYPRIINRFQ